ncbi:thiol peroxidase [Arthrospira platensis SPKY1]|nr:thiol peroxidase [Arthrospira platensis SPKY1]
MATVTLAGNAVNTNGSLPNVGTKAPDFTLVKADLSSVSLSDYSGKRLILNIFPSIDTGVCAQSVRTFNEKAASIENTKVLCISRDLPFAQKRFCGAEGIDNIEVLSDFRNGSFGDAYGLTFVDGALTGLHARAVVVLNENAEVVYTELVPEITSEPNYEMALASL